MGLRCGAMALTLTVVVVVVLMAVSVEGYGGRRRVVNHICRYTETKVDNCTRTVYYPCPDEDSQEDSQEDSTDAPEDEHEDGALSRRRRSSDYYANFWRFRYRRRYSNVKWCEKEETYTCIMFRCYIACCPGWKVDEDLGTCSIREDPKPAIECMNGGTAVQGDSGPKCECPSMYTGTRCEEVRCELECMNDGMCSVFEGRPRCVCSDDFNGTRCENPVCENGCGSYGYCAAEEGEARCHCIHGYMGRNCERRVPEPEKEGDCPPLTPTSVGTCAETCEVDSECPGKQKCCSNGCGHMCAHPANYTCPYLGHNYKIGDIFNPTPCDVCTCVTPDPSKEYGGAKCQRPICPPVENCKEIKQDETRCCEYCADPPVTEAPEVDHDQPVTEAPEVYNEPRFLNCPVVLVTIDVAHDKNEARLPPLMLHARDHKGAVLAVLLPKTVFTAGIGGQNYDIVIATSSRDARGNFALCKFHVRIRDVHAPNFTFCPTDVYLPKEGQATWEMPQAEDNVGLVRPPISRHKSGDYFKKGDHPVVYISEDYEGNIARCHFFVKVPESAALINKNHDSYTKDKALMFIGSGIAFLLLVVVIIIIAVLCRRHRRREPQATPPPPAYENAIYSLTGVPMPPAYKEKPPVYENEVIPEKKEEAMGEEDKSPLDADDVDVKLGIDNPTYRI
ncbi:uncharacterized protein LOC124152086 isoform X2 [Haliotis rufescens]|uniref:uncharacterized protein LOC124152086 isoform X2 n=1 Tax=Haliotis rufescens TaxID=6454 RepID=UPI00201EB2C7|nr:uncharacterized protein LOC124152086 isoform X2 [Haliotis rufescens]